MKYRCTFPPSDERQPEPLADREGLVIDAASPADAAWAAAKPHIETYVASVVDATQETTLGQYLAAEKRYVDVEVADDGPFAGRYLIANPSDRAHVHEIHYPRYLQESPGGCQEEHRCYHRGQWHQDI